MYQPHDYSQDPEWLQPHARKTEPEFAREAPIRATSSFIMSDTGGLALVSAFFGSVILVAGCYWIISGWQSLGRRGGDNAIIGVILACIPVLLGLALLVFCCYNLLDYFGPPVRVRGSVTGRHEERKEVKDRYGNVTGINYYFEIDFLADTSQGFTPVRLKLTEEQFLACWHTNRAYVEFGKRLRYVRLYQVLS
ncbi:MAG TPA: hypothetical protein VH186_05070 [Chloroflexia bacterium]|nr:hypothetical protein [Chloroflexia bacterium]